MSEDNGDTLNSQVLAASQSSSDADVAGKTGLSLGSKQAKYVVEPREDEGEVLLDFDEKHEFEEAEKSRSPPSNPTSSNLTNYSDLLAPLSPSSSSAAPNRCSTAGDSGIDRTRMSSSASGTGSNSGRGANQEERKPMWTKFQKQMRRFGGSTGSLSSSPNSEERPPAYGVSVYSPEVEQMDSPVEGGFRNIPSTPKSVAMLKRHIKELHKQLSKAEKDKQGIADEAFRRAQTIRTEYEARLDDARRSQTKQADLVARLQVGVGV